METGALDRIFAALADPARRGMIERLSRGQATVKELAQPAGMRLPSALKHLRVLEEGGLVASRKVGRSRTFAIRPEALALLDDWLSRRKAAHHAAFSRLADAMQRIPEDIT